ncbi:hypothetical protein STREPTOSP366_17620 [Streptomyces variabilis]
MQLTVGGTAIPKAGKNPLPRDWVRRPSTKAAMVQVLYHGGMALKRTNVYADDSDLLLIKEAAARLGVSEAEIIREGIHRIALAHRVWDEPFVSDEETFDLGGSVAKDEIRSAVTRGYEERERRNQGNAA